jgi:thiamine biosynthesis lipoprotein
MIALALLAASIAGRHEFREIHMGVEVRIVLHADDTERAATAARAAFDRVRAWDDALSDWRPDTPAQRLPTRAGESRRVDGRLRHALDASWRMGTVTAGGFEAGLGSLTRLWREARHTRTMPEDAMLAQAQACAGRQAWAWDATESLFTARRDGVRMDFGAIGQGLAADEALEALREAGCPQALVDVSGDIALGDAPPGEAGWRIEVEPGVEDQARETLLLERVAVSTSGDASQVTRIDGQSVGHMLDPSTGRPLQAPRQSTVIAADAATADAVATALCTLPLDQAIAVARSATIAARIDRRPDDGGVQAIGRWSELRRASSGPAGAPPAPAAARPSPASVASDPPGSPPRPSR